MNDRPSVPLEVDWITVSNLSVSVGIPCGSLLTVLEHRGVVNVALNLVLRRVELDFKLSEFTSLHELVDDFDHSFHAFIRVRDFEVLEVFHLS